MSFSVKKFFLKLLLDPAQLERIANKNTVINVKLCLNIFNFLKNVKFNFNTNR